MPLQRYDYREMLIHRMWSINYLIPHYFSELFITAEQLLTPEEKEQLHEMQFEVEKMVLETQMNPKEIDGKIVWVEEVTGELSMYDIEMAMESNPDYYGYFEKDDGTRVTKFDVERKLNKIKQWIYERVLEKAQNTRFKRFIGM